MYFCILPIVRPIIYFTNLQWVISLSICCGQINSSKAIAFSQLAFITGKLLKNFPESVRSSITSVVPFDFVRMGGHHYLILVNAFVLWHSAPFYD